MGLHIGRNIATTPAGYALDSIGAFQGAGLDAVAFRFVAPVSAPLTDVYLPAPAAGGPPGNLPFQLRNAASATVPGSTLHASQTDVTPAPSANKWIRCTFST